MQYCNLSAAQTAQHFESDIKNGLSEKEAQKRLIKNGRNELEREKRPNILLRLAKQLEDFMTVVLLCAAAVSFGVSFISGERDFAEPVIILAIVVLNAALSVIQELRAEHSLEALKKLSAPTARVIRSGKEMRIGSENVVTGDIIKLRQGDMVCADCRLVNSKNLTVNESHLTGESHEVAKDADILCDPLTSAADIKNTVFASSSVTSGEAVAIAVKCGMDTEVGKIASMLIKSPKPETPLQKKLSHTGKTLGYAALLICAVIFVIGTMRHIPPMDMFMTSVSLAVAAIPEGLPAIVTILLALGVVKMVKQNAIVRNLPSVETLGTATVICTDKTGTLTQNKMKVAKVKTHDTSLFYRLCTLCSEDSESTNPTDTALLLAAKSCGIDIKAYKAAHPISDFIPFTSERKRMSVLCDGKIIVKGAVEYILPLCSNVHTPHGAEPMSPKAKGKIIGDNNAMAKEALRVIAVAYRTDPTAVAVTEQNLTFVGLCGIYDPPRPEAKGAVRAAKDAGIRTIMITGDHPDTAMAIAKKTGIAQEGETAVLGTDIDKLSEKETADILKTHSVFARVTPAHKLKIVNSFQKSGEICAMTGDGVNDAPALKGANIGCSMGICGTDVAKSASDIILTDDNFATIVAAVKEGRRIYDNIKKSVKFLLSSNIGEILTVLFSIIASFASPLTATELLWVNLVTDSLPAIALGLDLPDKNIMHRPPANSRKGLFDGNLWRSITLEGLMIGALASLAYTVGIKFTQDPLSARTMSFFVLSVSQLSHAFNMRSESPVIGKNLFQNKLLTLSFVLGLTLQLTIVYLPQANILFGTTPLGIPCLAAVCLLSLTPLILVDTQKRLNLAVSKRI